MSAELCRLCGKDGLSNIYDDTDLWRKIFVCFGVEITKNDQITQKICKSCYFFTNSVYEFRLSSIDHDNKLKIEYAKTHPKDEPKSIPPVPISYPSEISQDAFLNTLNLASKNDAVLKDPVCHSSVLKLKRKWPNINLPKECMDVDLDPMVHLVVPSKLLKQDLQNMGIWSVKSKQSRGKRADLVLTRIRSEKSREGSLNGSASDDSNKYKVNLRHRNSAANNNQGQSTSTNDGTKKKRKKYPDWNSGGRKKAKVVKSPPQKKIPPPKPKIAEKIQKDLATPTKSETVSLSVSPPEIIVEERSALKSLLESDVHLNESLPKDRPSPTSSPSPRPVEYDLLVTAGEEVQTFICQTCNKIFDTLNSLNIHKKFSHKSSLRCTKCSKRFPIVESLFKHNLTYHPEMVATANTSSNDIPESSITKEDTEVDDIATNLIKASHFPIMHNTVARKHTYGTDSNRSSLSSPNSPEIMEYIISDDDDVEITDVIHNVNTNKESSNFDSIIDAALEPQKSSSNEGNNINSSLLYKDLEHQEVPSDDKETKSAELKTPQKPVSNDKVVLIDDSDDESEAKPSTSQEEPLFLILDDSNPDDKIMEKTTQSSESSSSLPSTSTDTEPTKIDQNIRKKIVVVPSAEDKPHMNALSYDKAKITNELSYINYIFNKFSFSTNKNENSTQSQVGMKWFLKDINKFTEKTYLPVELNCVNDLEPSVEYSPVIPEEPVVTVPFWETFDAIDIPKSNKITLYQAPAKIQSPPKIKILKESSFVSQAPANKSKPEEQTVAIQPVGPNCTAMATLTPLSKPVKVQSKPTVSQAAPTNAQATPTITQNKSTTAQAKPTIAQNKSTTAQAKPTIAQNKSTIAQAKPTIAQNKPTAAQAKPTAAQTPPQPEVSSAGPIANIIPAQKPMPASNIVSNAMFLISSPQSPQSGGNIQVISTPATGTVPNNQNPKPSNALVPVVSASSPVFQNVQSPSNIDMHTKLLNIALQNAAVNYAQQTSQVRSYSKPQSNPKLVLPASPASATDTRSSTPEQIPNGYILFGVTPLASNEPGALIVNDSNCIQKQPIVLNGMSYPSFAKIRNSNTPTFVLQQVGQQTNVNIQNCINICQQEVVTQNSVTEQYINAPFVLQEQSKNVTAPSVTLPQIQAGSSILRSVIASQAQSEIATVQSGPSILRSVITSQAQSETTTVQSIETTSDATVSTTRPTIRIKDLSELRGDNLNMNQRNELHNLYTNTLTNYVQNHSNNLTNQTTNDEYLQIS